MYLIVCLFSLGFDYSVRYFGVFHEKFDFGPMVVVFIFRRRNASLGTTRNNNTYTQNTENILVSSVECC